MIVPVVPHGISFVRNYRCNDVLFENELFLFQSSTPPVSSPRHATLRRKITRRQVWAWIGRSEQKEHLRGIIRTDNFRSIALGTANQRLSEIDRDRDGSPLTAQLSCSPPRPDRCCFERDRLSSPAICIRVRETSINGPLSMELHVSKN